MNLTKSTERKLTELDLQRLRVVELLELIIIRIKPVSRAEVISPRQIDQLGSQSQGLSFEQTNVGDFIQEVAGLTTFHDALLGGVFMQNMVQT